VEALFSFEKFVTVYQPAWWNIPGNLNVDHYCCENLMFHGCVCVGHYIQHVSTVTNVFMFVIVISGGSMFISDLSP
jgi:hypothetical protein